MARTTKDASMRAREALDAAAKRLAKATERYDRIAAELLAAEAELLAARKRHEFLSQDPDLPTAARPDPYVEPSPGE